MICPNCGLELPSDSEFCEYCGMHLEKDTLTEENPQNTHQKNEQTCAQCGKIVPDDSDFCPYCGSEIRHELLHDAGQFGGKNQKSNELNKKQPKEKAQRKAKEKRARAKQFCRKCGGEIDATSKRCSKCGKQYFNGRKALPIFLITLLLALLAGALAWQLICNQNISAENEMLSDKNTQLEKTVSNLRGKNTQLEKKVSNFREETDGYRLIISAAKKGNFGYAADNFKSSDDIIFVQKNETDCKITLTANWTYGGNVNYTYSPRTNPSANISFDLDHWNTSTTVTIIPKHTGVTKVTFTNDVDDQSFDIVIIVY